MNEWRELLGQLKFLGEIERHEFLVNLYRGGPAGAEVLHEALRGDDPLLKMMLLRHLEEIPERQALRLALSRLEDPNEVVREAAGRAYEHSLFPHKSALLRSFVSSKHSWASRFAVRTLARLRDQQILPLILAMLPRAEEGVRREMLKALRYLPDPKAVDALRAYAASSDEETRYHAVRSLAVMPWQGLPPPAQVFLRAAHDTSARVRQAALSALGQYSSRKIAGFLSETAFSGQGPDRVWAVQALASFPERRWVPELVALIASEARGTLRLAAEITLKRFPEGLLKEGLLPMLKEPKPALRRQAAILLAELRSDDPEVRAHLIALWHGTRALPERLALLDVLRELGGDEGFDLLLEALGESPLLAYAATSVLNRLWGPGRSLRLLSLLKQPGLASPTRQALLSTLSRRRLEGEAASTLFPILVAGLDDQVANIRYVCIQALAWYPLENILDPIVSLLAKEADAHVARLAEKVMLKALGHDPRPLLAAVRRLGAPKHALGPMVRLLTAHAWSHDAIHGLLAHVSQAPLSLEERSPSDYTELALHLVETGGETLEAALAGLREPAAQRRLLAQARDRRIDPARRFPALPLDFLRQRLAGGKDEDRALLYELLAADRTAEAVPVMTACLLEEKNEERLKHGREALQRLIREAV